MSKTRKLTLSEVSHIQALLCSDEETGGYYGPREQYYARTRRLIKWCGEQIKEYARAEKKKGQR